MLIVSKQKKSTLSNKKYVTAIDYNTERKKWSHFDLKS